MMENITKSLLPAGVAKAEDNESEIESDGSGEMDSGEDLSESSDEEPPPPPPPPVRRPPVRSNKKHNAIIRRIPHRDFLKQKRKSDALKEFHKFSKKMKLDTGLSIKTIAGGDIVELDELLSDSDESFTREFSDSSDGFSDPEFTIDPEAALQPDQGNESFIDPETGAITVPGQGGGAEAEAEASNGAPSESAEPSSDSNTNHDETKTLSISDLIDGGSELDLSKNVDIEEILGANQFTIQKSNDGLNDNKEIATQEGDDAEYDITEKLKEMGEISVKAVKREEPDESDMQGRGDSGPPAEPPDHAAPTSDGDEDKSKMNALNVRRNIREVMDEKQLDASTLAAQRQELERLARVQEQQRIIREVRRQIALGRQEKAGASLLKGGPNLHKLNLPGTVLVKLPSGESKKSMSKLGQADILKVQKSKGNLTPSVSIAPVGSVKKEVVEIVDSSSSSSSSSESPSSDSDDCIMLSDSELPPSPEPDEDPQNSGLHVNDTYNSPDEQGRVVINFGHPENEEDIFLAPQIGRIIKPHQIGGVRFLFDNIIESVERFSTSTGFGCILAHSMGLGKTLQIVCFCDIFLRHTNSKTVLCIMPINTLQNWVAEFNMWLPLDPTVSPLSMHGEVRSRNFPIYVLNDSHKTLQARAKVIKEWTEVGGVLMIGYELYRLLSLKKHKKPRNRKKTDKPPGKSSDSKDKLESKDGDKSSDSIKQNLPSDDVEKKPADNTTADGLKCDEKMGKDEDGDGLEKEKLDDDDETDEEKKLLDCMFAALVKPGPDLVICDEGHRIKNSHSNISYALKQMRTKRRIVLTGYPLQNNLLEYWCMVDFVRPNYLGTKTEFSNMFERPIQNGQCIDSTPQDIRLMRYRAHVLHSLLVGFVQRRSHAVLQSTLPQKEEYVLLVRMTDLQRKLYDTFMNEVVRKKTVPNPLKAFAVCCKLWNHPDVLYYFLKKREEMAAMIDYDLEIEDATPTAATATANSKKKPGPVPKKGKARTRAQTKKGNDKTPLAPNTANSGKPAATIPPNTSNSNPVGENYNSYDPNKGVHPNGGQYGYGQDMNQQPNPYPPYGYQQFPQQHHPQHHPQQHPQQHPQLHHPQHQQQNYYGQSDPYAQQYGGGYYPPQHYGGEYNQYNAPNSQDPNVANIPPPQQNYPQNAPYNSQGYWGQDGNYYNHSNPDFYQNHSGYQNNQDPYNTYDPYAQQTQPYHGFNQNRSYDRNVPNGELNQAGFGSGGQSGAPYEAPAPSVAPPFPLQPAAESTYDSAMYPGYQPVPSEPLLEKSAVLETPLDVTPWPLPPVDSKSVDGFDQIDIKSELKTDSDADFKIADLDTMKVIDDIKPKIENEMKPEISELKNELKEEKIINEVLAKPEDIKESALDKTEQSKTKNKSEKGKPKKAKDKTKAKDKKVKKGGKNSKDKSKKDDDSGKESDDERKDKDDSDLRKMEMKEEVPYEWANDLLKTYIPGIIENSAKMEIFFCILIESIRLGDRLLLFSQSLFTLNLIEDFLQRNLIPGSDVLWAKNKSYYRLDGSTSALEREKLINEFNSNPNIHLFLVSTRAGSLGINLVGANRVIVFDASWNPCHDTQAVCRVYRYGQKKPCFVYRLVMDNCLEKKIYDRQINKQGMADRVVDECNPDAVLSMKEVTNLCWDSEDKASEAQDLREDCKEKYLDVIMRKIIEEHARTLSKEPFQHESLLVDRKEKKLSSAEKRLAQRGYELEKKAAANPKPSLMYRTIRTADGSIIQRPVASVRPMQHGGSGGARWIPAEVWQRQGMTAQEMTLPLDVVIPTNSAEKSNIVLKAGQRVMVLKSPKGIYMQLESGKIIAIKTSFKVGQNKDGTPVSKEGGILKKVVPSRPTNLPGSLKNNSAITVISKSSSRGGLQKIATRPTILQGKQVRPFVSGQRIQEIKIRSAPSPPSVTMLRGRAPPRPARPIPIQNKLNIKIQGAASPLPPLGVPSSSTHMTSSSASFTAIQINPSEVPEKGSSTRALAVISPEQCAGEVSNKNPNPERGTEQSDDGGEDFDPGDVVNKVLRPALSEDVVSEDSSQEKTYVDLSDKSESKIMTKLSSKKSLERSAPALLINAEAPAKKTLVETDSIRLSFGNEVTVKRTTVPAPSVPSISSLREACHPAPVNLIADEVFPSEATLSERRLPSSRPSSIHSADENSAEDESTFKEKKVYKPNLIDRKPKINALKNYRHPKLGLKSTPTQSELGASSTSPASSPSTPTPPPAPCTLAQLEMAASSISRGTKGGGVSDFRQSLSEITKTYSPDPTEQPGYKPGPKSRKKKQLQIESSPDSSEMLSKPIPIDTSLMKPNVGSVAPAPMPLAPAPVPLAPAPAPYMPPAGAVPAYGDPTYLQQPPDPNAPPQQPYGAYPGYPPGGGAYPHYPAAPYYPQYPPHPYAQYPPPYPPAPYPPYPPQW